MHKRFVLTLAGAASVLVATAATALAAPGFVDERTALRAGPGARYPTIDIMRSGDSVDILGCLPRWAWCDVIWRGERGWARGASLEVLYQSRRAPILRFGRSIGIPFVQFNVQRYWGDYYRDRPFYRDIPRFGGRLDFDIRRDRDRDGDVRDRNRRDRDGDGVIERREDRRMDQRRDRIEERRGVEVPNRQEERRPERRPDADRPAERGPGPFGSGRQAPPAQPAPPQAAPPQAAPPQADAPRGRGPFGGGAAPQQQQEQAPPPPRGRGNGRGPDEERERGERRPFGGER